MSYARHVKRQNKEPSREHLITENERLHKHIAKLQEMIKTMIALNKPEQQLNEWLNSDDYKP